MGVKNLLSLLNSVIESKKIYQKLDDSIMIMDSGDTTDFKMGEDSSSIITMPSEIFTPPNQFTLKKFADFSGQKIAIDASLLIYQYVIGIRNTSNDLTSVDGRFTSHIHAVVSKSLLYLDNNITPIFVFDGKPSNIKSNILINRRLERRNAKEKMDVEMDESEKRKLFKKSTIITYKQMKECQEILTAMGIPVIEAEEEADSQLAYLTKEFPDVYGAGSEDVDLLAFGANRFLKNISSSKKNNIIEYDLDSTLANFGICMHEFINLCILLGCDYVDVIPGITPKIAYEIIKKHHTIPNFLISDDSKFYDIPKYYYNQVIAAYNYFLRCPHKKVNKDDLKCGPYDAYKIKELLIKKYSYCRTKVEKIIAKLGMESKKMTDSSDPKRLNDFFSRRMDNHFQRTKEV